MIFVLTIEKTLRHDEQGALTALKLVKLLDRYRFVLFWLGEDVWCFNIWLVDELDLSDLLWLEHLRIVLNLAADQFSLEWFRVIRTWVLLLKAEVLHS